MMNKNDAIDLTDLTEEEEQFLQEMQSLTQQIKSNYDDLQMMELPKSELVSEVITLEEAKQRYEAMADFYYDEKHVHVLKGNVFIEGDLDTKWLDVHKAPLAGASEITLTIIVGNVIVKGAVLDDDYITLLIIGELTCSNLHSVDGQILIAGNAKVITTITGIYNDGQLIIQGETSVPFVLDSDHSIEIKEVDEAIWINHSGSYKEDTKFSYKYRNLECHRLFLPEIWENEDEFSQDNFNYLLKNGESPFLSFDEKNKA